MKQFLTLCGVTILPPWFALWLLWIGPIVSEPEKDAYFTKLRPKNASGLILGTSRFSLGIDPETLEQNCPELKGGFNYCFNLQDSPISTQYATVTTRQISRLQPGPDGFLIIQVDPWNLRDTLSHPSTWIEEDQNNTFVRAHTYAARSPIFSRLLGTTEKDLSKAVYNYVTTKFYNPFIQHISKRGWEQSQNLRSAETASSMTLRHVAKYRRKYPRLKTWPATASLAALDNIIASFKSLRPNGAVYLIRPTAREEMLQLENELYPEFNDYMITMANQHEVQFFDATGLNQGLQFSDGHHLHYESAVIFSERLADALCSPQFE